MNGEHDHSAGEPSQDIVSGPDAASGELSRRGFHQLTAAAFGGLLAGSTWGCSSSQTDKPADAGAAANTAEEATTGEVVEVTETIEEPAAETTAGDEVASADLHACRGLNTCKGLGKDGMNECAGQGTCTTFAEHSCAGENACKGQGGCGSNPAANECKGMGGCMLPLHEGAWETAREAFEERMKMDGKTFGAAPAAAA